MNKNIFKICCMCMSLCAVAFSSYAEEAALVVAERTDCVAISAQIETLNAMTDKDDAATEELAQLQATYRRDCAPRATGRGAISRAARAIPVNTPVAADKVTVAAAATQTVNPLDKYMAAKKENCDMLKSEIAKATADADMTKQMQAQYDADCVDGGKPVDVNAPVDTRSAAEKVADNLAAGLCADGTKPNKYGCCTGETFRDMGDAIFACCPDDGGDCMPPIETGGDV